MIFLSKATIIFIYVGYQFLGLNIHPGGTNNSFLKELE
jgi:hypothetical protein